MARIAIAGNPNAGKTSLFNELTGTLQKVSNYPGVTVERKEGTITLRGERVTVIDLPGTYSLTAYSHEELVARRVIVDEQPELVVVVVDASNLERNLYLLIQIMEMRVPTVVALNMADRAESRGLHIDREHLATLLGTPVVRTVGSRGAGLDELREVCAGVLAGELSATPRPVTYGHEVNQEVDELEALFETLPAIASRYHPRWAAVKLIENDDEFTERFQACCAEAWATVLPQVERARKKIGAHFDEDPATIVAERRYGFAAGAMKEVVTRTASSKQDTTDQIDAIVCNRYLGPLIMVGVVTGLFFSVFKLSEEWTYIPWFGGWMSPTGWMEWLFEQTSILIAPLEAHAPMLHSLLDDGIIGGVGGVMSFVPLIFFMFLFISALEDTGYIARVAFILDRLLRAFGMQGKSILSMIVAGGLGAGGCAVPAVMATRTLREERDRLITMLVVPFMNCGAKMPVYAMLIAAFFASYQTQMMLILWALSWVVALSAAWVLRRYVIRGEQTPFVMELPPYHVPIFRSVLRHTWEKTWLYMRKAGTIILLINIVLWAMMYFPRPPEIVQTAQASSAASQSEEPNDFDRLRYSAAGRLGNLIEPVSQWAGFDWRTNIALIGGFAAKEIIVGTLGIAYSMGDHPANEESLPGRLKADPAWGPLKAFALMIFVMIYAPCLTTVAVIRKESGSWKWAAFSTIYATAIALAASTLVYQGGLLLGLG